jgi:hypothetical protein
MPLLTLQDDLIRRGNLPCVLHVARASCSIETQANGSIAAESSVLMEFGQQPLGVLSVEPLTQACAGR